MINPKDLATSRVQLHYAIQFIAMTGAALVQPQPDYSHTTFHWDPDLKVFVGTSILASQSFRVALEPVNLTALILDSQGQRLASLSLHQRTLAEGLDWHKTEMAKLGAAVEKVVLWNYPMKDFPDHPIAHGTPFDVSQVEERQALVAYYEHTQPLLQQIATTTAGATPVHAWPHHFDMATLITLPGQKNGESMSIGIGLTPGDASYDEPYWYIAPWPYPDTTNLPKLVSGGSWHTEGWVGAFLLASQLGNITTKAVQQQVQAFINHAVATSQQLLHE